jgi:hypothetical protein
MVASKDDEAVVGKSALFVGRHDLPNKIHDLQHKVSKSPFPVLSLYSSETAIE